MRYFLPCLILLASAQLARAEIVYDIYFRAAGFDSFDGELIVGADSIITNVEILLRETTTAGEVSTLEGPSGGMRGFAIDVRSNAPNSFRSLIRNSAFQFNGVGIDSDTITAFNFGGGVAGTRLDANKVVVSLGTLELTSPSANERTTFTIADFDLDNPNQELIAGPIDGVVSYRSLTLVAATAIPEPQSLAFLAVAGVGLVIRRRRRV